MRVLFLLAAFSHAVPHAAGFVANLTISTCTASGCVPAQKRVALDATSNGTEALITADGASLTLKFGGIALGGPRVYLIEEEGVNKNHLFELKNQEFTFDVELSTMPCGFNAALYFVGMTENEGGAEDGTKYCDAQAVGGTFCSEMDIMEANTRAQQYTTHACVDSCASYSDASECKGNGHASSVCDQSGCGLNPFRYGPGTTYDDETTNAHWHGPGSGYALDSTKPFTVVTQFQTEGSELSSIKRFYKQEGHRVDLPDLYVKKPNGGDYQHKEPFHEPSITAGYCADIYDRWSGEASYAPLAQMGKCMENGMVLAMSAWYAQETYTNGKPAGSQTGMSWLDGVNNWGKYIEAGPCHQTTSSNGDHAATFSNIRIGDIGTTLNPGPSPPGPSPAPPSPPSPPAPSPSGCPGGSIGSCMQLCPSNPIVAYQACVKSCVARCV